MRVLIAWTRRRVVALATTALLLLFLIWRAARQRPDSKATGNGHWDIFKDSVVNLDDSGAEDDERPTATESAIRKQQPRPSSSSSYSSSSSKKTSYRIAVCVSGQPSRMQPNFLLDSLVKANPQVDFFLFYNLQLGPAVFNTAKDRIFAPSPYGEMSMEAIRGNLSHLFSDERNANLVSVNFHGRKPPREWTRIVGGKLDRITQYEESQASILNMYLLHKACADNVAKYETNELKGRQFDRLVVTREDVYFFLPVDLPSLLAKTAENGEDCDVLTKDCLAWDGINMRFQLLSKKARTVLSSRVNYYRKLRGSRRTVRNPEIFEREQAEEMGLNLCTATVRELPATAARYTDNGGFCFIRLEILDQFRRPCFPAEVKDFIKARNCTVARKLLDQGKKIVYDM